MKLKLAKYVLCASSLFLLTSCSFFENIFDFITGGDEDSEETYSEDDDSYVPTVKVTSLDVTDGKSTYYTNEIFDNANQLSVTAHYSDGTSGTVSKGDGYTTGYKYTLKDSANKVYSGDAWTPTFPTINYKIKLMSFKHIYHISCRSVLYIKFNIGIFLISRVGGINKNFQSEGFRDFCNPFSN